MLEQLQEEDVGLGVLEAALEGLGEGRADAGGEDDVVRVARDTAGGSARMWRARGATYTASMPVLVPVRWPRMFVRRLEVMMCCEECLRGGEKLARGGARENDLCMFIRRVGCA